MSQTCAQYLPSAIKNTDFRIPSVITRRCKIAFVSTGPQLTPPSEPQHRNWLPLIIAASVIVTLGAIFLFLYPHGSTAPKVTPVSTPLDPYADNLQITSLAMSYSTNFIGGQVMYLDGHIVNKGARTVTGITVQVLFRDYTGIVSVNNTQPLKLIRMRTPYIDVEPVSADPIKPGTGKDFRLFFDGIPSNWNGQYPQIRIIKVETR